MQNTRNTKYGIASYCGFFIFCPVFSSQWGDGMNRAPYRVVIYLALCTEAKNAESLRFERMRNVSYFVEGTYRARSDAFFSPVEKKMWRRVESNYEKCRPTRSVRVDTNVHRKSPPFTWAPRSTIEFSVKVYCLELLSSSWVGTCPFSFCLFYITFRCEKLSWGASVFLTSGSARAAHAVMF